MPDFDFDSLNSAKEEKKTTIISQTYEVIITKDIHKGKEQNTHYNRNDPCMSCGKEMYGSGESGGCVICDKVLTETELKLFLKLEKPTLKPSEIKAKVKAFKQESKAEPIDLDLTPIEPKVEKPKIQPKITPIQKQFIPSFIMVFNGRQGSGKSTAAQLFPTPFILDLEYGKNADSIKYSTLEQIKNLKLGTMNDIKNKKEAIDIVSVQDREIKKTWDNIKECVEWYKNIGAKTHQTIIFDTTLWIRESRIALEESKKGRQITKFEYKPISEDEQELLYDLIDFCRTYERNLIFITHWTGKYQSFKNEKGYADSELVGEIPDIKDWYLDAVTWRIDFLKPEESGYNKKYIVYLDKAPRYQYSKLDITNKYLFDIINNLESFEKEINEYKKLEEPTEILDLVGK